MRNMRRLGIAATLSAVAISSDAHAQAAPDTKHLIVDPSILASPTREQIAALYPPDAVSSNVAPFVLMQCAVSRVGDLSGCTVLKDGSPGLGFGDAALKLAPDFKLSPRTVDGIPTDGAMVKITIKFPPAPTPPLRMAELKSFPDDNPAVTCAARGSRATPAQRAGVEGVALAACQYHSDGSPVRCTWTFEAPPNHGLGASAAETSCRFKIKPRPTDATDDWVVSVPVRFQGSNN